MDSKRLILALALSAAVIFGMQALFPSAKPTQGKQADSLAVQNAAQKNAQQSANASTVSPATAITAGTTSAAVGTTANNPATIGAVDSNVMTTAAMPIVAETTVVAVRKDSGAVFMMSSMGAAPAAIVMNSYKFAQPNRKERLVDLRISDRTLLQYKLAPGGRTPIDLSKTLFTVSRNGNVVTYQGMVENQNISIQYTFTPDGHNVHITGTAPGMQDGFLVVSLPSTLPTTEQDTTHDYNNLGYAYLSKRDGARRVLFSELDPGEKLQVDGPINWTAAKNKYFVIGLLVPEKGIPFSEVTLTGGARVSKIATQATADVVVPIKNGTFAFDLYAGPQEWKRLNALGRNFDEVNPYGWAFLGGILQPIATAVIRLVLWMHQSMALSYGMVLVVLGLLVRIVLWPLNQTAMRTSLKMQEFQPKIQALQDKYKDNVEEQRKQIMKLYQEHGMSPFSPFLGCLPMLLPMPVLFALFFVFQNTIEFRGVSFLWVHDLSVYDPYYIWPILMAASMYLLSWIGMRNAPSNPQAKLISYIMPAMMLIFLGRLAAGLNVYYAAQNIAALPQQWFIAREQAKRRALQVDGKTVATKSSATTSTKSSKRG